MQSLWRQKGSTKENTTANPSAMMPHGLCTEAGNTKSNTKKFCDSVERVSATMLCAQGPLTCKARSGATTPSVGQLRALAPLKRRTNVLNNDKVASGLLCCQQHRALGTAWRPLLRRALVRAAAASAPATYAPPSADRLVMEVSGQQVRMDAQRRAIWPHALVLVTITCRSAAAPCTQCHRLCDVHARADNSRDRRNWTPG
jgi:hypothetical protein